MGTQRRADSTLFGGIPMIYDAVIVGGGASGLTAAAYLTKFGRRVLLCEKEGACGGLVNSFERDGFVFDSGIRALEDAGVLFTMLRQLGLEIEFVKNRISIGIEDQVIEIESDRSLDDYGNLLANLYPESKNEIIAIINDLRVIMHYMDIQYGIDNPLFLDPKKDRDYFIKAVLPWIFKYALTVRKVMAKNRPVIPYLQDYTSNQSLLDIITQHFFTETPAYFALSYFKIFQEYYYPKSGTGAFTRKLVEFIKQYGGEIRTNTRITTIDLHNNSLTTAEGDTIQYSQLLWAADQKSLYQSVNVENLKDIKTLDAFKKRKTLIADMIGNDSVLTLYLMVNLDKSYFENIATGHFFYTPSRIGQSAAGKMPINGSKHEIQTWLKKFLTLTTYEISIPVLRDSSLAPSGKSGLIISLLFDYRLTKTIHENGWDGAFKELVTQTMVGTLDSSIYPGLAEAVIDSFIFTPLTLQKVAGTTDGAITGWSFTNHPMPAESRLASITNSVNTPLTNVSQAGQWTYSPAGFPVSLITGKLAADKINKLLRKSNSETKK
jgi:phytoene dehydrogenase-like protein